MKMSNATLLRGKPLFYHHLASNGNYVNHPFPFLNKCKNLPVFKILQQRGSTMYYCFQEALSDLKKIYQNGLLWLSSYWKFFKSCGRSGIYISSIICIQDMPTKVYSECCQTSKMNLFVKTISNFQSLTILEKTPSLMFNRVHDQPLGQYVQELGSYFPEIHTSLGNIYFSMFHLYQLQSNKVKKEIH